MDANLYMKEENRELEQAFARSLTGDDELHLSFMDVNDCYTDGKDILINPAVRDVYKNEEILYMTEKVLGLERMVSRNPQKALKLIARCQTTLCSLKMLYSAFPRPYEKDASLEKGIEQNVMQCICETIEEAFIDAIGASEYPILEPYLKFHRLMEYYGKDDPAELLTRQLKEEQLKSTLLFEYLSYMRRWTLYPKSMYEPDERIKGYIEKTKQLYLGGALSSNPEVRYDYAKSILKEIVDLVPMNKKETSKANKNGLTIEEENEDGGFHTRKDSQKEDGEEIDTPEREFEKFGKRGDGSGAMATPSKKNVNDPSDADDDIENIGEKNGVNGETDPKELHRLFEKLLEEADFSQEFSQEDFFWEDQQILEQQEIVEERDYQAERYAKNGAHNGIIVCTVEKKNYAGGREEYRNICKKFRSAIRNYRTKMRNILAVPSEQVSHKHLVGTGIDSTRLGDSKKKYWYKKESDIDMPELAVLFMIDNSGSMDGKRRDSVVQSLVILNEVLKGQGIDYAMFTHQAIAGKPVVLHNFLMDFHSKERDKYRICDIHPNDGSRDGITLLWAEQYLLANTNCTNRIIIVLSDGEPMHYSGKSSYTMPFSAQDSAEVAKSVIRRGTKIVAIALDDGGTPCYNTLKKIYGETISCENLERLPRLMLELVAKQLK